MAIAELLKNGEIQGVCRQSGRWGSSARGARGPVVSLRKTGRPSGGSGSGPWDSETEPSPVAPEECTRGPKGLWRSWNEHFRSPACVRFAQTTQQIWISLHHLGLTFSKGSDRILPMRVNVNDLSILDFGQTNMHPSVSRHDGKPTQCGEPKHNLRWGGGRGATGGRPRRRLR